MDSTSDFKPKLLLLDVDGVLTNGQFYYDSSGKVLKVFGPDDNDAISLLSNYLEIRCITGDRKGFDISSKRIVDDMKLKLDLVSTVNRIKWIKERFNPREIIYMGDGIFDHYVMREVGYAIAPRNADKLAIKHSHYVTQREGANRAVAEACIHIMDKFFKPYDPNDFPIYNSEGRGEWGI